MRSTSLNASRSLQRHLQSAGVPLYPVSAATGEGLDRLLEAVWREVAAARERARRAPRRSIDSLNDLCGTARHPGRNLRPDSRRTCGHRSGGSSGARAGPRDPDDIPHPASPARSAGCLRVPPVRHGCVGRQRRRRARSVRHGTERPRSDVYGRHAGATTRRGLRPSQIFFITGADAFADIATWSRYPHVLDMAHFVVVSRPGYAVSELAAKLPALARRMQPARRDDGDRENPAIFLLDARTPDVSSTDLRRRFAAMESVGGLVPAAVETHIAQHHLYSESRSTPLIPTADHLHGQD